MIHSECLQVLCDAPVRPDGRYVLYWMQQSQRAEFNPALELAIEFANSLDLPVLVAFGLTAFPEANARHYDFMLRGLAEVRARLTKRGVAFVIRKQPPHELVRGLASDAALVVCDRGYLRIQRAWREALAKDLGRRLIQVEGDAVVPVEVASDRHETAARTLRPKLQRLWDDFLNAVEPRPLHRRADGLAIASDVDLGDVPRLLHSLKIDQAVGPVRRFAPGEGAARSLLARFLDDGLERYARDRSRPEAGAASLMSPYLHFGQISPVEIVLAVRRASRGEGSKAYVEELVVRRELAFNHVHFAPNYDRYTALPSWARQSLAAHRDDPRPAIYTAEQLEAADTHDPHWNTAMREMRTTGYMHNVMRMYWGKKILQWSPSPEAAFETALALNNRWFLDGRDANSFTNVGWLFGLHDRPWPNQPVFGAVRAMGQNSLRKFDTAAYARQVEALVAAESARAA
ncbi:MAG: deoxyribodipyrimidine photo-lyase [Proteobacteria bacterium]|nr:deoxyribodipyrimidine photo-lyase [Pseudomonadota bacterium]